MGHKYSRPLGHETADVIVTFSHSTIQDFLGAFYFILSLNVHRNVAGMKYDSSHFEQNYCDFGVFL